MYKKTRIAKIKRRIQGKKRIERRQLARELLSGALSLAQVEDRDPQGLSRVLRTVSYLNKSEGITIPSAIIPAVSHALEPATFGVSIPQVTLESKENTRRGSSARKTMPASSIEGDIVAAQVIPATPTPRRRRVIPSKSNSPQPTEVELTAEVSETPKKATTTRRTKKANLVDEADSGKGNITSEDGARKNTTSSPGRRVARAKSSTDPLVKEKVTKPRRSRRQISETTTDDGK